MRHHGGRLRRAAAQSCIPLSDWLDLSTGINPEAWPAHRMTFSADDWQRLPEPEDGLLEAMQHYYGSALGLPCAGSQAAIQALPSLWPVAQRVAMLPLSYHEHAHAWENAGHSVLALAREEMEARLDELDVLLLVNPNNPTGERFSPDRLRHWHDRLAERGGWLVIDEAFMDATPEGSLLSHLDENSHCVVLRSLGKFFGLAGARVGFAFAPTALRLRLQAALGPWTLSGPARQVTRACLQDDDWVLSMRQTLAAQSARLAEVLGASGLVVHGGCALFQWCQTPDAQALYEHCAERGVLLRLFESPSSLRFALPRAEADWQRLFEALSSGVEKCRV